MAKNIREFIEAVDYQGLENILSKDPSLANSGIPCDEKNKTLAHPLHRICDGVFNGQYTDVQAEAMAKIFLSFGARADGDGLKEKKDTPLVAAASLQADRVALLLIGEGADISHAGCHGGTALHWAAWCGRDKVLKSLLEKNAELNKLCIDFKSTPLFWAIHGYKFGGEKNIHHQIACAQMLIHAGADKNIPNFEGCLPLQLLDETDEELLKLFR